MSSIPTLQQMFDNKDFFAAVLFCGAALIGQLAHAVKKSLDGDASCVDWFRKDLKRTLSAIIGNGLGMLVFVQTGVLTDVLTGPNGGWWSVILFGLMNGFTADSALNKSTRTEWTDAQRADAQK